MAPYPTLYEVTEILSQLFEQQHSRPPESSTDLELWAIQPTNNKTVAKAKAAPVKPVER